MKQFRNITFSKYQGAGNDFVMIDNRNGKLKGSETALFAHLCHRKFGVGADGLILLNPSTTANFEMIYCNADGGIGSMCGNGGRCAVAFAKELGLIQDIGNFIHAQTTYTFQILSNDFVELSLLSKIPAIETLNSTSFFVNTGSPHYVRFVTDVEHFDVVTEGKKIRYSKDYEAINGTNVNFVQFLDKDKIFVRTYERGVEAETLSCGTGVTAAALAYLALSKQHLSEIVVKTLGGVLIVQLRETGNIQLIGPASKVFEGEIVV